MSSSKAAPRPSLMAEQQRAVESLKAALFGDDPYVRRKYILDFHKEYHAYRSRIARERLITACAGTDIVFIGDYHALPSCQTFAAEMLGKLANRGQQVALVMEMFFSRDQKTLDAFMAGQIGDAALRRRIRYERDWGYPWDGYGRLLEAARASGVRVLAADAPPRGGLRMIRRRDRHAAFKIVEWLAGGAQRQAIVLFGESHMARRHLPGETRRELARRRMRRSSVVIVQNVEEIYWQLARASRLAADTVTLGSRRYCVFNASPLAKYEAYRQTLLRWWQQEEEGPDFGPSVHHLIDLLVERIGLDRYRRRVPVPGGGTALLIDQYPEVVSDDDRRTHPSTRVRPGRRLARPGVIYRADENRIDVFAFSLAGAAEAAARFLLAALRGDAGRRAANGRTRARSFPERPWAAEVLDEAFVAFAVRFLDPMIPLGSRQGVDLGIPRATRSGRPATGILSLMGLAPASGGKPGRPGQGRMYEADARRAVRLGQSLGNDLYHRLRNRPPTARMRAFLLEIARLGYGSGKGRDSRVARLLDEAARYAGWSR